METKMETLEEKKQEEDSFSTQFGRFQQAKRGGQDLEAHLLQLKIVAEHGTWVE